MKIKAYAKINLTLDVVGVANSGYHLVETILQQIDLHDTLIFKKISGTKIILETNDACLPLDQKNTIYKAIKLLENYCCKIPSGLHVTLQKNIPVAAGLGGGSSDAAATLKALNSLWNLDISLQELENMASEIGMDVPFFIRGGTAFADHFGEKIQPLPSPKKLHLLLIDPEIRMETVEAYKQIDNFPCGLEKAKTSQLITLLKQEKNIQEKKFFHNDFNQIYPEKIQTLYKKLFELGALSVNCTGSGPLIYATFKTAKSRNQTFEIVNQQKIKVWKIKVFPSRK